MQFKITKDLRSGKYLVFLKLSEWTPDDQKKASKFGVPNISIKHPNGPMVGAPISLLDNYPPFAFGTQPEADQYADNLKAQITKMKEKWNQEEDSWSNEEIL